ncbi:MAG: phosphoglucosamine mutase [Gammaproteobacteria bacterium]|nr:phosphoglucosamine mutase [Gammaproteobacteria bacterium]
MSKKRYFGTDGIRGRVGESIINPEFVLKLGWAAGKVLLNGKAGKVLIGKDTRVSGYIFESLLEAGFAAAGADVRLLGPTPTPAIAYLTRAFRAKAGIVISASHNPFYDNGIKFFSSDGLKLSDAMEFLIEKELDKPLVMCDPAKLGHVKRYDDATGRYVEFCKSTFGGFNSSLAGMKIILDCANGATYKVAPRVFIELGAEVVEINVDPDGLNINENCGSTKPEILAKIVLAENADLGIAFDGDGDRVIMVDHLGNVVDGDQIIYIIAKHEKAIGKLSAGVVGTVMTNLGLEQALNDLDIEFMRTTVGDRFVIEALQKTGWLLGGETSGHIVHHGITTTGDGIVTALQVLSALQYYDKTLYDLASEMHKYPQIMRNVKVKGIVNLEENKELKNLVIQAREKLGKTGRVVLRPSGTEPVVRVMAEGEDRELVNSLVDSLTEKVSSMV